MRILIFLCLTLAIHAQGQQLIQGIIRDSRQKTGLPFCNVGIKGTSKGCLANEDGVFKIEAAKRDTLVVSYLGYQTQEVLVSLVQANNTIDLQSKNLSLREVVIHGDDDHLYGQLERCRKKLLNRSRETARVYFQLMSERKGEPTEMVECYYNGVVKGSSLRELNFKNGRVALAKSNDGGYFLNVNTSKAIYLLNLTADNHQFPTSPLQFSWKEMKKRFVLEEKSYDPETKTYQLVFRPRANVTRSFEGEMWISGNDELLRIHLVRDNAAVHPFIPFMGGSLRQMDFDITEDFTEEEGRLVPQRINFGYQFVYSNYGVDYQYIPKGDTVSVQLEDTVFTVKVDGLMHFYDYKSLFILPKGEFSFGSDYRQIAATPYIEAFWNGASGLVLTDKQQKALEFFEKNGRKLGHERLLPVANPQDSLGKWRTITSFWDSSMRVQLGPPIPEFGSPPPQRFVPTPNVSKYNLKVHLFLDVNPGEKGFQYTTATVFNLYESYTTLDQTPLTDCVFNMFFDLCELHRRKLESTLNDQLWTETQVDSIYQAEVIKMDKETSLFLKDVQLGKDFRALEWWNARIHKELGMDNIKLFAVKPEEEGKQ